MRPARPGPVRVTRRCEVDFIRSRRMSARLGPAGTNTLAVSMPGIRDAGPEFEEFVVAGGSGEGHEKRLENHMAVHTGGRVVGHGEKGAGEVAEDIGVVEAGAAGIALGDPGAFYRPADAGFDGAGSLAKVARIRVVEGRKDAENQEPKRNLAKAIAGKTVAEGAGIHAIFGIPAGELTDAGGEELGHESRWDEAAMKGEEDLIPGREGRELLAGIHVLDPLAVRGR